MVVLVEGGGIHLNKECSLIFPNSSRYCKEILQIYFCIIRDCVACLLLSSYVAMATIFQLVTESRNEQSHLDSMILARFHSNLVGGMTHGYKSQINQKHIL